MNQKQLLENTQDCAVKSFGNNNPDKVFLVIRQEGLGRGLFSLLAGVMCYLDFADRCGFVPVIDFENFKTEYNEPELVNETLNSFEYYFLPVSNVSLDEVYSSKCVLLSSNQFPKGYRYSATNVPGLYNIYDKYIKIQPEILRAVQMEGRIVAGEFLGVHLRGQEFRTAPGHWFPPSEKQFLRAVNRLLERNGNLKRIFAVTEDLRLLDFVEREFKGMVVSNSHYRTSGGNAYRVYPRPLHKYLLGREIMEDMICLSQCDALVACTSNVSEIARFINNGKFSERIQIMNGPNSRFSPLAKVLWQLKNALPPSLGGFSIDDKTLVLSKKL